MWTPGDRDLGGSPWSLSNTTSKEVDSKHRGSAFFALLLPIEVNFNKSLILSQSSCSRKTLGQLTVFRLFGSKWRGVSAINKNDTEFNEDNSNKNYPHFTSAEKVAFFSLLLFQLLLEWGFSRAPQRRLKMCWIHIKQENSIDTKEQGKNLHCSCLTGFA